MKERVVGVQGDAPWTLGENGEVLAIPAPASILTAQETEPGDKLWALTTVGMSSNTWAENAHGRTSATVGIRYANFGTVLYVAKDESLPTWGLNWRLGVANQTPPRRQTWAVTIPTFPSKSQWIRSWMQRAYRQSEVKRAERKATAAIEAVGAMNPDTLEGRLYMAMRTWERVWMETWCAIGRIAGVPRQFGVEYGQWHAAGLKIRKGLRWNETFILNSQIGTWAGFVLCWEDRQAIADRIVRRACPPSVQRRIMPLVEYMIGAGGSYPTYVVPVPGVAGIPRRGGRRTGAVQAGTPLATERVCWTVGRGVWSLITQGITKYGVFIIPQLCDARDYEELGSLQLNGECSGSVLCEGPRGTPAWMDTAREGTSTPENLSSTPRQTVVPIKMIKLWNKALKALEGRSDPKQPVGIRTGRAVWVCRGFPWVLVDDRTQKAHYVQCVRYNIPVVKEIPSTIGRLPGPGTERYFLVRQGAVRDGVWVITDGDWKKPEPVAAPMMSWAPLAFYRLEETSGRAVGVLPYTSDKTRATWVALLKALEPPAPATAGETTVCS